MQTDPALETSRPGLAGGPRQTKFVGPRGVRITDALLWVLVLFPLLTGGVWVHRPGIKLEHSQLAVPVFLLGLWWLGVTRLGRRSMPWGAMSSIRFARAIWNRWRERFNSQPMGVTTALSLGFGALLTLASWRRHWAGASSAFDLGIFSQTLWNLTHGNGYVSSLKDGINLFQDHQSPLFWVLAPLYALIPRPETLLAVQAMGLALGAVPLAALALQYRSRRAPVWLAPLLPWIYWAHPALRAANAFDFHPEVLMLPLFLAALAGLQSARISARWLGAMALLGAVAAKESAGPIAAGIGLAWVLGGGPHSTRAFTRRLGWAVGAAGVAAFALDVWGVPRLFGTSYAYGGAFSHLSQGGVGDWVYSLMGPSRIRFLTFLLVPVGLLPLLSPGYALWALLPALLMLFLGQGDLRVGTIFHYGIEPLVGLLWACAAARSEGRTRSRWLLGVLLFGALIGHGRSELFRIRFHEISPHAGWMRKEVLPALRADASLAATANWVPHLSERAWVNVFPKTEIPQGAPGVAGAREVDCILVDLDGDPWPLSAAEVRSRVAALGAGGGASAVGGYRLEWSCGSVRVFSRAGAPRGCWAQGAMRPGCGN